MPAGVDMTAPFPTVALSIQQPWAHLIVTGVKDVENRTWPHGFRGPVLIHAGKTIDEFAVSMLRRGFHPAHRGLPDGSPAPLRLELPETWQTGGIVGVAEVTDCVNFYGGSDWFQGPYGYLLANAKPLPFMPLRGQLGFFRATYVQPEKETQP